MSHRAAQDLTAYGDQVGGDYDRVYAPVLDTGHEVERLAELAGDGPVLELGVGTGRLALPLAARGLEVHGVDSSAAMLDRLRAKPGAEHLHLVEGDFTDVDLGGEFALVVLAFNTIYALPSQEAQVECFANAARQLRRGGRFVVAAWIHDPSRFHDGVGVWPRCTGEGTAFVVGRDDPVAQRLSVTELHVSEQGTRTVEMTHRYASPAELDLMARFAGLEREHRWRDWRRGAFTARSREHVTVYRRG
jgi:SAM-dependent methyltransferase